MEIDRPKLDSSIKVGHQSRFIAKYIYGIPARIFLNLFIKFNFSIFLVDTLKLIFSIFAALSIIFYPQYLWIAALLIFIAGIMDFCDDVFSKYSRKNSLYSSWLEEMNSLISIFLIFLAGAYYSFINTQNANVLFVLALATFSYLSMNYAGALIKVLEQEYSLRESLADIFKKTLSKKTSLPKEYITFSFDYQWTLIILATLFGQFLILFWLFVAIGTFRWLIKYITLSGR